jgi:hypothetical protein
MPTSAPEQTSDTPESPPAKRMLAVDSPLHPVSLAAGAGSAAVAAVIGGQLGLSGTVIGAAVGSIVAALTATTIRASVRRSHEAAVALATRRHTGMDPTPPDTVPVEVAEPEIPNTTWSGWARGAVTVAAAFALGIAGVLLVQLGLGRNLSPGTGQLQSAAPVTLPVASQTPTYSTTPSATPVSLASATP